MTRDPLDGLGALDPAMAAAVAISRAGIDVIDTTPADELAADARELDAARELAAGDLGVFQTPPAITVRTDLVLYIDPADLIRSAAIGYWGFPFWTGAKTVAIHVDDGSDDDGANPVFRGTPDELVKRGIRAMVRHVARNGTMGIAFARILSGQGDRHDHDLVIQFAVFGEERFS